MRVVRQGVWVTDDLAGVAMWDPPGKGEDSAGTEGYAEEAWARYRANAGEQAWDRLASYNDAVAGASPAEPYWYLGVLATHPERRCEGLASAVIAPVLGEADRLGVACCLETSTYLPAGLVPRPGTP